MSAGGSVLVLNCGSSSVKYQLIEPESGRVIAHGLVERIGEEEIGNHEEALRLVFDSIDTGDVVVVGHRVVHGGQKFHEPTVLDDAVVAQIAELSSLAPLHNPAGVQGIEVARRLLPDVPQVAVLTPRSSSACHRRRPSTRWIVLSQSDMASVATGFTVPRTSMCRSRPRPSWGVGMPTSTRSCCIWATGRRRRRFCAAARWKPRWA